MQPPPFIPFPRVIGTIDCTHIPTSAPLGENEADNVNGTFLQLECSGKSYNSRLQCTLSICTLIAVFCPKLQFVFYLFSVILI